MRRRMDTPSGEMCGTGSESEGSTEKACVMHVWREVCHRFTVHPCMEVCTYLCLCVCVWWMCMSVRACVVQLQCLY